MSTCRRPCDVRSLVVATRNAGKLREISKLVADLDLEVLSLAQFPEATEVEEPYESFAENAAHKATVVARELGLLAMADDSGLQVHALGGRPGVYSSRVASSDPERIAWLLDQLRDVPPERRQARFVCAIALASPEQLVGQWEEAADGIIATAPAGTHGFGYDPVFYYPPAGKTFAEMTTEEKSAVSHRGKALRAFRRALPGILKQLG